MQPLEEIADQSLEQYHRFSTECRHLVTTELRSGRYEQLYGPSKKSGNMEDIKHYRARVNIMGRPGHKSPVRGKRARTLEIGHREIMIFITYPLNDLSDYAKGFNTEKGYHITFKVGMDFLPSSEDKLAEIISKEYFPRRAGIKNALQAGDYKKFVSGILEIADNYVAAVKSGMQSRLPESRRAETGAYNQA